VTRPGKYVRDYYRVPAFIGARVRYTYGAHSEGTITGFDGQYLIVKMDGEGRARRRPRYHPTWEIEYL
jgi:hypothetical protein